MDERAVRHILLARYYLHLAADQMSSPTEPAKFVAINLYHEALEATLITCAGHLNAKIEGKSEIAPYLDRIDEKLVGQKLPFRIKILQFNKARVSAKHYLILPDESFLKSIETVVPEFIETAIRLTFGKELSEISLIDLVEDQEVGGYIREAQAYLDASESYKCLISARKAFYLQFEKQYDIREFSDRGPLSALSMCRAPYFTRNPEYIHKNVSRPGDYIVIDHSVIQSDLMKNGIDVDIFWNIWRLTPAVYRYENVRWAVEHDFDIADDPGIKNNCIYVIDNLISITLQRETRSKRFKSRARTYRYIQTVPNAPFYKKAEEGSEVTGRLPDGVMRVNIDQLVPALDGKGYYWHASYMAKNGSWLSGFVNSMDTEGQPQFGFVVDGINIAEATAGTLTSEDGTLVE
jgi:hypothetical protein